jgi:hypothetical protein
MQAFGAVEVQFYAFFTFAIHSGESSASRPYRFNHGERAPYNKMLGGWVDLITSVRMLLPEIETRTSNLT